MKRWLLIAVFLPFIAQAHIPAHTDGTEATLAPMLKVVTPAVVNIAVEKIMSANQLDPFAQPKPPESPHAAPTPGASPQAPTHALAVGSGVIFNAHQGLIVTNAHVIHNQHIMVVSLKDGRRFRATLVGEDDGFDIAIIKIPAHNLTALPFGDSDQLKVGDFVAAIGSPFGLTQTVTSGVVSALNRSQPQLEGFQSFIQTDAPINPGNSGGALVDLHGKLVGINTAIITPFDANIGIGFSIPSNMVHSVLQQLLKYGKVKRGMLGVIAQDISPELADAMHLKTTHGSLVTDVVPNSPAAKAGILSEDVITEINDKHIRGSAQLRNTLGLMRPGTSVKLTLRRNHTVKTLTATIGDPTKITAPNTNGFLAGLNLQDFSELLGDGNTLNGVRVTNINEMSAGALAGLIPGDVITHADGKAVHNTDALRALAAKAHDRLLLKVFRGNKAAFLVIQP